MSIDEQYMQEALVECRGALEQELFPVGAVVVHNGEIIGRGKRGENGRVDHAETNALRDSFSKKMYKRGDGLTVYTTLEPCVMCFGTILNCPVERVVDALEDPYGGAAGHLTKATVPPRHTDKYPEVVAGIMRHEAKELLCQYLLDPKDDFWKQNRYNPLAQLCRE